MKRLIFLLTVAAGFAVWAPPVRAADGAVPRRGFAEIRAETDGDFRHPEVRRRVAEELARAERERRAAANDRARQLGLPLRGDKPGGGAWELAGFEGDQPLYRTTLNANAAVSTGANLVRLAPYGVDGSGGTVGIWDACSARTTHREFGGRVVSMDGAALTEDHSTHVAGTAARNARWTIDTARSPFDAKRTSAGSFARCRRASSSLHSGGR